MKFRESLPKPITDLYMMTVIRKFNPTSHFQALNEIIRAEIHLCSINTWAEQIAIMLK